MTTCARDLMTADVQTVGPREPILELVRLLASQRVGSLPVVAKGRLLGVIAQADVVRELALEEMTADWLLDLLDVAGDRSGKLAEFVSSRVSEKRVEDLMQASPITVEASDEVREVARQLSDQRIHHAPVLEAGRFVGIISTLDLVDWIAKGG